MAQLTRKTAGAAEDQRRNVWHFCVPSRSRPAEEDRTEVRISFASCSPVDMRHPVWMNGLPRQYILSGSFRITVRHSAVAPPLVLRCSSGESLAGRDHAGDLLWWVLTHRECLARITAPRTKSLFSNDRRRRTLPHLASSGLGTDRATRKLAVFPGALSHRSRPRGEDSHRGMAAAGGTFTATDIWG
jgi:hypothetical protein